MSEALVTLTIEDSLARITLSNTERNNVVSLAFCKRFAEVCEEVRARTEVRVVAIKAVGKMFSVGGDIGEFAEHAANVKPQVYAMASTLHRGLVALHESEAVSVVAVNGTAAGAGLGIVLGADIAVAAQSAKFVAGYAQLCVTPDGGATYHLPRIVGYQRAFHILASNRLLTAEDALRLGLLGEVVADAELEPSVEKLVQTLLRSGNSPSVLKKLLQQSADATLSEQLAVEADSIAALAESDASKASVRAFQESRRRKP